MVDFNDASIWMKLATMLVSSSFSMHLFAMDVPIGWSSYEIQTCSGNALCYDNEDAVKAVQALEVIGFLLVLISLFLSLCLVLLDELKRSRCGIVLLSLTSILGGLAIIIGIAVYEGRTNIGETNGTEFASTIGVMAGICAIFAGIFCLVDLLGFTVYY